MPFVDLNSIQAGTPKGNGQSSTPVATSTTTITPTVGDVTNSTDVNSQDELTLQAMQDIDTSQYQQVISPSDIPKQPATDTIVTEPAVQPTSLPDMEGVRQITGPEIGEKTSEPVLTAVQALDKAVQQTAIIPQPDKDLGDGEGLLPPEIEAIPEAEAIVVTEPGVETSEVNLPKLPDMQITPSPNLEEVKIDDVNPLTQQIQDTDPSVIAADAITASDELKTDEVEVIKVENASVEGETVQPSIEAVVKEEAVQPKVEVTSDSIVEVTTPVEELPDLSATPITPTESEEVNPVEKPAIADLELEQREYSLDELLAETLKQGASDLHLAAGYRALIRVDGELKNAGSSILNNEQIIRMLQGVIEIRKDVKLEDIAEIDIAYELKDKARFRVNIYRQQGSYAAAFRLISNEIKNLTELKLPQKLMDFTTLSQGLVLVTGPTGSGKTTTLASLINEINKTRSTHIITIEDPIEYVYPSRLALVTQREMHKDSHSWEEALRSALRQDPDVVLVGEMRDLETIAAALTVAETGHLVFATLHTNSAAQTIDRLIDVFPMGKQAQIRTQLASVLKAVVSQRLVPINGGGRRAAVEMMITTPAISHSIREGKVYQLDNMIQTGAEIGMVTMEKSLVGLVREGLISTDVALTYANRPDDVLALLGQHGK